MPTELNQDNPENQPLIELENIAVRYRIPHEQFSGIKEYAIRWLQKRVSYEEFWALKGISFSVYPGDIFGIIGRNGAGKSTMLKVLARVLYPTEGRLVLRGKVAPLLELGGGFNPELTGRENVYLNGALLGYSRPEIDEFFPSILEFSEIGDFIDAPLRTYSTGMVARLGFSIATCKKPEILLVDEVLSVGDTGFQRKCFERIMSYNAEGSTILIVSHSINSIQSLCSKVLWLDHGTVRMVGGVKEVSNEYVKSSKAEIALKNGSGGQEEKFVFHDVQNDHWAYRYVEAVDRGGFLTGHPDGSFRPDQAFTRLQMAIISLLIKNGNKYTPPPAKKQIFADIPISYWAANWAEQMLEQGLSISRNGEKFWPEQGITRAEAAYIFLRASKPQNFQPEPGKDLFKDAPREYWAAPWIETAVKEGWMAPIDQNQSLFKPETPLSRAEIAEILCGLLSLI